MDDRLACLGPPLERLIFGLISGDELRDQSAVAGEMKKGGKTHGEFEARGPALSQRELGRCRCVGSGGGVRVRRLGDNVCGCNGSGVRNVI
jgi:hypothetical protein